MQYILRDHRSCGYTTLALAIAVLSTATNAAQPVEEIIVTGLKTDVGVQDTPVSVAITTGEDIEQKALQGMFDVLQQTANVVTDPGGSFSIRGMNAFGVSANGGVNNPQSALASVYVDDAPMSFRMVQEGALSTWDVAQIEVMRGPQSTLQGKNTLAGAVIITTQEPQYEYDAKLKAGVGSDGYQDLAFAGGGGLIENQLAYRVSAQKLDHDGYNEAPFMKGNSDFRSSENYRAKLLFEPAQIDDFKGQLSYTKNKSKNGVRYVNDADEGEDIFRRSLDFNTPTWEATDTDMWVLKLEQGINDNWQVLGVTTYTDMTYDYSWDSDYTAEPLAEQFNLTKDKTKTLELRTSFNYDRVTGIVGAYYADGDNKTNTTGNQQRILASLGAAQQLSSLGLDDQQVGAVLDIYAASNADPIDLGLSSMAARDVANKALFTDVTVLLGAGFDLMLGARIDHEKLKYSSVNQYAIQNVMPNPDDYGPYAAIITGVNQLLMGLAESASSETPESDATFSEFLPKLGLTYQQNDDLNYSLTYQEGYRSGGVSYNVIRGEVNPFDAEYTKNYELALRSQWFDKKLTLNANLFYIDWTGQQLTVYLGDSQFDSKTANVGSSKVEGLEISANYAFNNEITVYSAVGYSKTEFIDFEFEGDSYDGRPFTNAPEWTSHLGLTYQGASGLFLNANANYRDESIAKLNPNGIDGVEVKNESRTLIDLRVGYAWGARADYGVYLVVKNLMDEEYIHKADPNDTGLPTLGEPRQLMAEFNLAF